MFVWFSVVLKAYTPTFYTELHSVLQNNSSFAVGDDYLCVHLRRRDYLVSRPQQVPNISWAAAQLKTKLERLRLDTVFVATDSTPEGTLNFDRK